MRKDDLVFVSCLLFLLGVASGSLFSNPAIPVFIVIASAIILLFFYRQNILPIIFILPLFLIGFMHFNFDYQNFLTTSNRLDGRNLVLSGTISDLQSFDTYSIVTFKSSIGYFSFINNQNVNPRYGDQISISGVFKKPEADKLNYYYSKHLLGDIKSLKNLVTTPGINFNLYYWLQNLKVQEKAELVKIFGQRRGHLLSGLFFGESDQFTQDEKALYKRVGVYHLVALSGEQISLVALIIFFIIGIFVRRKKAAIFAGGLLLVYLLSTSLAASALRAYLMFLIYLGSLFFERINSSRNMIFLSATILVFLNPSFLLFNLGFQLSYIALISLIYIFPYLKNHFFPNANKFFDLFLITFSVELAITPLLFFYFGQANFLGILTNPLILWSSPFLFMLSLGSLISSYFIPTLLPIFYFLTNFICDYFFSVLDLIDYIFQGISFNIGFLEFLYITLAIILIIVFQQKYASRNS